MLSTLIVVEIKTQLSRVESITLNYGINSKIFQSRDKKPKRDQVWFMMYQTEDVSCKNSIRQPKVFTNAA